ncbi:MAG: crossover junction endodeoxyribonuclease RuvC [Deltaproteobacteria bacterium]|nr:crossover junction endodeoxyribonuclease RuvC [Deltaproteobacteria bacterium]
MDQGPTKNSLRILGIDPGSLKMGWAVLACQGPLLRRIDSGTIRLSPRTPLPERLAAVLQASERLLGTYPCDVLAIEAAFVRDNPHTALVLGQARGIPIALAAARGLPVFEYPPATVKRTLVGSGRAEKSQMQHMIQTLLALTALPAEDEADALAVAITHAREAGFAMVAQPNRSSATAAVAAATPAVTPANTLYLQAVMAAKSKGRAR